MAITSSLGGVDRTAWIKLNTLNIRGDLNGPWSLSSQIEDQGRGFRPTKGHSIVIADGGTKRFAGNITRIVERRHPGTSSLTFDIEADDYNAILSRRTVTGNFTGMTLYEIVSWINRTSLSGEGIALSSGSPATDTVENPGPTITDALSFNYATVLQAFQTLSTITGRMFYVDFDKVLHFGLFTSSDAPFDLTDTSNKSRNWEIERDDADYRNRQHVRAETIVASSVGPGYTEDPITAAVGQWQFPVLYPIQQILHITVDSVEQEFGIVTKDEFDAAVALHTAPTPGVDWYYIVGFAEFDRLGSECAGGEVINCEFIPVIATPLSGAQAITVEDTAEQAARAALEGGSGIHESVSDQRDITSAGTLRDIGNGLIRQYGTDVIRFSYETDESGIAPGQRQHVTSTYHSLDEDFLVERVEMSLVAAQSGDLLRYRVTITNSEPFGNSVDYLVKLAQMARIGWPSATTGAESSTGELALTKPPTYTSGAWSVIGSSPPIAVWTDSTVGLQGSCVGSVTYFHGLMIAYPSGAFTLESGGTVGTNSGVGNACVMVMRDSSSEKLIYWGWNQDGTLIITKWSNPSTYHSAYFGLSLPALSGRGYWKFVDDGTDWKWYIRIPSGDWMLLFTVARNDFLTPDQIGWGIVTQGTVNDFFLLDHWKLTQP